MTDLPDPDACEALADQLRLAAGAFSGAVCGASQASHTALLEWTGAGRDAFADLTGRLNQDLFGLSAALREFAADVDHLAAETRQAERTLRVADYGEKAAWLATGAAIVQLGLNPAADAAALAARGGAAAGISAARRAAASVVEAAVARMASRAALGYTVRRLGLVSVTNASVAGVLSATLQAWANGGDIDPGTVAREAALGAVLPPSLRLSRAEREAAERVLKAGWLKYGFNLALNDANSAGHTLDRHVGKSIADLRRRVLVEGREQASSYPDRASADRSVREVVARRAREIERWLAGEGDETLDVTAGVTGVAGIVAARTPGGGVQITQAREATVVLLRDGNQAVILTSHPGRPSR